MKDGPGFRLRHPFALRILGATIIALVLGPGLVFALATVSFELPAPDTFRVPPVHVGDEGRYSFRVFTKDLWGETSPLLVDDAVRFRWDTPAWTLDRDLEWQWAPRAAISELAIRGMAGSHVEDADPASPLPASDPSMGTYFDLATGSILASSGRGIVSDPAESEVYQRWEWRNSTTLPPSAATHCGLVNPLQGRTENLGDGVRLAPTCWLAGGRFHDLSLKAVGSTRMDGQSCLHLRQTGATTLGARPSSYTFTVSFWFCRDTPYPVRILIDDPDGYHSEYVLQEFHRGSASPGDPDSPPPPVVPRVRLAPARPWGPDEAGIVHPFPLSEAYHLATEGDNATAKRWFDENPLFFVRRANYEERSDPSSVLRRWTLVFQTPSEAFHVRAEKSGTPHATASLVAANPGVEALSPETWGSYVPPDVLPTVASMHDVANALAVGAPHAMDGWSYSWGYADPRCNDVHSVHPRISASERCALSFGIRAEIDTYHETTPRPGLEQTEYVEAAVTFDQDGGLQGARDQHSIVIVNHTRAGTGISGTVTGAPPGTAVSIVVRHRGFEPDNRAWILTLLAVTAGALAATWPWVKQGAALLLFSRIQRASALDHPVRSEIMSNVEEVPGIHFQELRRRLDVGRGSLDHHLRKLVGARLIHQEIGNGFACYFAQGRVDRRLMQAVPHLKSSGAARLLHAVLERPGLSAGDASSLAAVDAGTGSYHLKRLGQLGLIEIQREGNRASLWATELGSQARRLIRLEGVADQAPGVG